MMNALRVRLTCCFIPCMMCVVNAQEIPVGTWRTHNSYNTVSALAIGSDRVYGAAAGGLIVFQSSDNSLTTITKLNGLTETGLSALAFDNDRSQLLIGYEDGTIDVLSGGKVKSLTDLKNASIGGSKRINNITVRKNAAYLDCPLGVMVIDLDKLEVKETYRDLGPSGETLEVFASDFLNDSLLIATESGLLEGDLTQNLLDFRNWKRYHPGGGSGPVTGVVTFNGTVFASVDGSGIFSRESENFVPFGLTGDRFKDLSRGLSRLTISSSSGLWTIDKDDQLTKVTAALIDKPLVSREDGTQTIWIGDSIHGLLAWHANTTTQYLPNGPAFQVPVRIRNIDDKTYLVSGGHDASSFQPLRTRPYYSSFANGSWTTDATISLDLEDVAAAGGAIYFASFGSGLEKHEGSSKVLLNDTNSPLQSSAGPAPHVLVSALASDGNDLWVANYGAPKPLHRLQVDGTWSSYTFTIGAASYPVNLFVDHAHRIWMTINPANGGGLVVFDPASDQSVYLTDQVNSGGLPSRNVFAVAEDQNNNIWVGTSNGVAFIINTANLLNSQVSAIRPILNNRYLLQDEKVNAIEVDGANRKWIGTDKGLWLFGSEGDEVIKSFTQTNSPLPSDKIVDLGLDGSTGELFIGTDKGLVSYRGEATTSADALEAVKIFPNPVYANFNGTVAITGLLSGVVVKITDIRGKLVWEGPANGGTAAWNIRDYSGKRPGTGVYLVFAATSDGSEKRVGKIAIVN